MLSALEEQCSDISLKLRDALIQRIAERRTDISQVLQYLHDGNQETNEVFTKLSKTSIAKILTKLLKRLLSSDAAPE